MGKMNDEDGAVLLYDCSDWGEFAVVDGEMNISDEKTMEKQKFETVDTVHLILPEKERSCWAVETAAKVAVFTTVGGTVELGAQLLEPEESRKVFL